MWNRQRQAEQAREILKEVEGETAAALRARDAERQPAN
jgi:hypothetical protein